MCRVLEYISYHYSNVFAILGGASFLMKMTVFCVTRCSRQGFHTLD